MRRFHFEGDDAHYIVFLEDIVQRYGLLQPTRLPTPSTVRGDSQVSKATTNSFQHTPPPSDNEERATSELQIIQYEPTKAKKNDRIRVNKERWRTELDSLLSPFPSIGALELKAEEVGLGNNQIVVSSLVDGFALHKNVADAANGEAFATFDPDALGALRRYALFTKKSSDEARLFWCLAKFQDLIFVSFCDVVLGIGESKKKVHEAMRLYISDSEGQNLDKIISGARWVNSCIVNLSKTAWGFRSPEVFVLGGQSMNFYGRYAEYSSKSKSYFLHQLKERTISFSDSKQSSRIPISIPCIIRLLTNDTIELPVICDILGYERSTTQDLFKRYYDGKFTNCNIWRTSASSSKHRHESDSCRNIRRPRPRKRARTTCSETRHETVPDGQSVSSFQQHYHPCADFQAVEALSQMKTYSDQQRNEFLPTQHAMPMSRQPTEVYPNDTNGARNQNSSEGTRTLCEVANTQIDPIFSSQSTPSSAAPIIWSNNQASMSNSMGRISSADEVTPSIDQCCPNSKEMDASDKRATAPETGNTDLLNWDIDFDSLGWDLDFTPGLDWELELQWAQM